jgi:beta-glucanase (GH16 family)
MLSSCGSADSSSNVNSISGVVTGSYYEGATVFLDCNNNGKKDALEHSTISGSNGAYTLLGDITCNIVANIPVNAIEHTTIGDAGTPILTKKSFATPAGSGGVISAITTKVYQQVLKGKTLAESEQIVATDINISSKDLFLNVNNITDTTSKETYHKKLKNIEATLPANISNTSNPVTSTPSSNPVQNTVVYNSVINDTFNNYDSSIWQKSDWANGGQFFNAWCPSQITFNSGNLSLLLNKIPCHSKTHASGEYRTSSTYKYGKYISRFKASDINGTISSFFTYTGPSDGTEWDEIDIEILGKDTTKMQVNYWRNGHEHPHLINLGFDASLTMHIYSFIWSPTSIGWYVDDILVFSVAENNLSNNDSLPINAGKIIINLWAGIGIDSWSGKYDINNSASATYDYIKFDALSL